MAGDRYLNRKVVDIMCITCAFFVHCPSLLIPPPLTLLNRKPKTKEPKNLPTAIPTEDATLAYVKVTFTN